jgi:hypothetical protein
MLTYAGRTQVAQALWAAGYRFFAPCDASLILHQWSRKRRPTFWVSIRQHTSAHVSIKKLKKIFCSKHRQTTRPPNSSAALLMRSWQGKKNLKIKNSAAATADDTAAQLLGCAAACATA